MPKAVSSARRNKYTFNRRHPPLETFCAQGCDFQKTPGYPHGAQRAAAYMCAMEQASKVRHAVWRPIDEAASEYFLLEPRPEDLRFVLVSDIMQFLSWSTHVDIVLRDMQGIRTREGPVFFIHRGYAVREFEGRALPPGIALGFHYWVSL